MPTLRSSLANLALSVTLSACSGGGNSAVGPGTDNGAYPSVPVALPADSALAACVRATAALNGIGLDSVGLASLRELAARGKGITSLEGIGMLRNLRTLDLSANQITDLSPLEDLDSLRELDLSGNRITDLTPLAELARLEVLLLQGNLIRDPSPLLRLTDLTEVELTSNPLETEAQTALAALSDRGVTVAVDESQTPDPGHSPTGTSTLAFSCDSGVYIANYPGGGSIPLTTEPAQYSDPVWSPDGMTLAFAAKLATDAAQRIYLVPRTGGQVIPAAATVATGYEGSPHWDPNGGRLAFVRAEKASYLSDLYLVTVATGAEQRLTADGSVGGTEWRPTGGTLAIQHKDWRTVSLLNLNDGNQSLLARGVEYTDNQHPWGLWAWTWSPDGTRLLLTGLPEGASATGIYVCQPSAIPELVLADTDSLKHAAPAWSPDGTSIVYERLVLIEKTKKTSRWQRHLAVCHLSTGAVKVYQSAFGLNPAGPQWSPDGAVIAFTGQSPGRDYSAVFVVSLADNAITQLTDESTPLPMGVAWAPR